MMVMMIVIMMMTDKSWIGWLGGWCKARPLPTTPTASPEIFILHPTENLKFQ